MVLDKDEDANSKSGLITYKDAVLWFTNLDSTNGTKIVFHSHVHVIKCNQSSFLKNFVIETSVQGYVELQVVKAYCKTSRKKNDHDSF